MSVRQILLSKIEPAATPLFVPSGGQGELVRGHAALTSAPDTVYKQSIHKEDP